MISEFVSRGGQKLQFGIEYFKVDLKDKICGDFGSSTGGFTDCMLKNGALKVYSVDTAYGELAWTLRNDNRVVVMERTNAMHVTLPELCDFISIDVGWTKQQDVLPNVFKNLKPDGKCISLFKPHYESGTGLINLEELSDEKLLDIQKTTEKSGFKFIGYTKSPIKGQRGKNTEYLLFLSK